MEKDRSVAKKPLDPVKQFRDWMKNTLRRAFFRYWERTKTIQNARVDRGLYKCAECKQISKIKGMRVDHISPVVETAVGFVNWDTYISRLFCSADNLQLLCGSCHDKKTEQERLERKAAKTGIYSPDRAGKISVAKLGIPNLKLRRPIIGKFGGQETLFDSTKQAAEITKLPRKRITDVLIGIRDQYKGWEFEYKESSNGSV